MEDKFINYLKYHYSIYKNINNIGRDAIVEYNSEILKIGTFLASIRRQHKLYINNDKRRGSMSATAKERYEELDKLNFEWEPFEKNQQELEKNDVCMLFIQKHYEKHKTLSNLPKIIIIDDKAYNIKSFLGHIRTNHAKYISNNNSKGSNSPTALRRYKILDSMGFVWTPSETKKIEYESNDIYISYLEKYYEEHKTLKGVPTEITFEGQKLNIENFLTARRTNHRMYLTNAEYKPSELEFKRWSQLDKLQIDWNPIQTAHQEKMNDDKHIRYLQMHFKKNKTINDITSKQTVEFEGEILKIGDFINEMRKKHLKYISMEKNAPGTKTELMLKRYEELEALNIDWRPSDSIKSIAEIARENSINIQRLKKFIKKFNGDIDKAIKICVDSTKYKNQTNQQTATLATELDINMNALKAYLNRSPLKVNTKKSILMYNENTALRQYCLDNGLNYDVIHNAIKSRMNGIHHDDLQTVIKKCIYEYNCRGQNKPLNWIYSKYENEILVKHMITYLNLDVDSVISDISRNNITLDQAMENNSFIRCSKQQYDYLEFIYRKLTTIYRNIEKNKYDLELVYEETINYIQLFAEEYRLTDKEKSVIALSLKMYINAHEQYKLFDVGFEKDNEAKVDKIIKYGLSEDEIEEAFFIPLKFNNKVLTGKDSTLHKRRVIMKNLTTWWSNYTIEEKKLKINHYQLSQNEIEYIKATRREIDEIKSKVLQKKVL